MPRISKATLLDRWIDAFSDMTIEDQAFALLQVQAIHRQIKRHQERFTAGSAPAPSNSAAEADQADIAF